MTCRMVHITVSAWVSTMTANDNRFTLDRSQVGLGAGFSLKLNPTLRSLLRSEGASIEFSSYDAGCFHFGEKEVPFTLVKEDTKELYDVNRPIFSDESTLVLKGLVERRLIVQHDLNESVAVSMIHKAEPTSAEKNKRKAITVDSVPIKRSRVATLSIPPPPRSSSPRTTMSVRSTKPQRMIAPDAPPAPIPVQRPLVSPPAHCWVVFRSLPTHVTARDIMEFLDGITMRNPPEVLAAPLSGDRVDVYVQLRTVDGADLAEMRSGEPMQVSGIGNMAVCVQRSGTPDMAGRVTLSEVFWARAMGIRLSGRHSCRDTLDSLVSRCPVLKELYSSSGAPMHPVNLCARWKAFAALVKVALPKDRCHKLKHVFSLSLPNSVMGSVNEMALPPPGGCDQCLEDLRDLYSLLRSLSLLWSESIIAFSASGWTEELSSVSPQAALELLGRIWQGLDSLRRFVESEYNMSIISTHECQRRL